MIHIGNVIYPEVFQGKRVLTHWDFEDDLKDIVERSGQKADFWGKYKQRLRHLEERGKDCILKKDWFEALKHAEGIFAMKFNKSQKNIRILFSFLEIQGKSYAVLLYAFQEKDNKRKSKNSYDTGIPIAKSRLKEVLES